MFQTQVLGPTTLITELFNAAGRLNKPKHNDFVHRGVISSAVMLSLFQFLLYCLQNQSKLAPSSVGTVYNELKKICFLFLSP
jgi:hypothetical protein